MDLIKENIPVLVRKLAIPASVGTLFQTLYNIVDTFYSGLISPEALSALSKSFPIYFIIVATIIKYIGKDLLKADRASGEISPE